MATQEISDYVNGLSSATLVGTEELYLDTDEKCTVDELRTYISGGYATKTINIGAWDMDADGFVDIEHELDYSKIRDISIMIQNDSENLLTPFISQGQSSIIFVTISTTNDHIRITRNGGGNFDNTSYDDTGVNRGFVTISYIA